MRLLLIEDEKKTAAALRSIPNAPIASATEGSVSTGKRSSNAAKAAANPVAPSAQAACRRTKGAGSASAAASAGRSCSVPGLPSTTDALRLSPVNLARFMGDPENAAEKSACDISSNATAKARASLSTSASRGESADSRSQRPTANSSHRFQDAEHGMAVHVFERQVHAVRAEIDGYGVRMRGPEFPDGP